MLIPIDFETFSEADLKTVGTVVYAEHPSTEILSMAFELNGIKHLWIPEMGALPRELIEAVKNQVKFTGWNTTFEYFIWNLTGVRKYRFPPLDYQQLICTMARARAHSLPGALADSGKVLQIEQQKIEDGKRLLNKFSKPRKPTKNNPSTRIRPIDDPIDADALYRYNIRDIEAEAEIGTMIPWLSDFEYQVWLLDQKINIRGVGLDVKAVQDCAAIMESAEEKYTPILVELTKGKVTSAGEVSKITEWVEGVLDVEIEKLTKEELEYFLDDDTLPDNVRTVLEIRQTLGSASVKKLNKMVSMADSTDSIRNIFAYCGADRTGRWAGMGVQPQNFPNSGPKIHKCETCRKHSKKSSVACPYCGGSVFSSAEWGAEVMEEAFEVFSTRSTDYVEHIYGDPAKAIAGSLRGLLRAREGYDLICSDFSAIEAVVLAQLAGEQWRNEVFATHGKIYEMSASKISGVPFEEFLEHKKRTGDHHPLRKTVGKVAELASGYQGGVGAWKKFKADKFLTEDEMKEKIKAWREASPNIVKFWWGIEAAAIQAVQMPGEISDFRGLKWQVRGKVLYCKLLSGRELSYHEPTLVPSQTPWGKDIMKLTFKSFKKSSQGKGKGSGWLTQDTYGGKLTENIVQATSRDLLAFSMTNLDRAGYDIVLHIHDEIVSEVPKGFGSVEEFERIMSTMPDWAKGWSVFAKGGWRGERYRKD